MGTGSIVCASVYYSVLTSLGDVVAASPEPDVTPSLAEFGNFVGVESLTATATPVVPSGSASDLVGLDGNIVSTSANKVATKDDIMALYGPANNSTPYNMPGECVCSLSSSISSDNSSSGSSSSSVKSVPGHCIEALFIG